ncbi:squalene/phytoene synthase family protein [Phormidesmis sp. 146-20]
MNTLPISRLVGSSEYRAIADDTLKDEDNAAWIMELDPEIREQWIERIHWIRLADRLAENGLIHSEKSQFQWFYDSWNWLKETGEVQPGCPHSKLFYRMRDRWFEDLSDPIGHLSIQSWDQYLSSLAKYHKGHLVISSFDQFEGMLEDLAAPFFQVLPFLSEHQWHAAGQFGTLDQFYNNLRDLREDAEQGICYLPTELLDRFKVSRAEILSLQAIDNPGYRPMMKFWIHEYLPQLHRKAYPFILAPDLHPSWQMLRDWSLHRYRRIERIFRRCDYDYLRFPRLYWQEVKRDLVLMLPGTFGSAIEKSAKQTSYLSRTSKLFQISELTRLSHPKDPTVDPVSPYTLNAG